jgi:hypothetical protein
MKPPLDLLQVAHVNTKSTYRHLGARSAMSIQEIYTDDESRVAKSGLGIYTTTVQSLGYSLTEVPAPNFTSI